MTRVIYSTRSSAPPAAYLVPKESWLGCRRASKCLSAGTEDAFRTMTWSQERSLSKRPPTLHTFRCISGRF